MVTHRSQSAVVSLSVHVGAVALVLLLSRQAITIQADKLVKAAVPLYAPKIVTPLRFGPKAGGGGMHQDAPAPKGNPPKFGPTFIAPVANPKLAMQPTLEVEPDASVMSSLSNVGDPLSKFTSGAGGGSGGPAGLGNGNGKGIGDGNGDSIGARVYTAGNGVTRPILISGGDPEFSEDARKAKHGGLVKLRIDVDPTGRPRNLRVVQSLGLGLDEKAMEAVSKWVFKPGTKDGKPVAVTAIVDVMFHLL